MSNWRKDPASEAQKRRLALAKINFPSSITKGEASDLIDGAGEPGEDQILILKFFKITGIAKMSKGDATKTIKSIFNKDENKKRWENRPADKEQREIYKFFNLKIPPNLTGKDAERFINNLWEDEEKFDAWDRRRDEIDARDNWLEYNRDRLNDDCKYFNCKKINKKLFKQVVESLESSGMTLEQIEKNDNIFFKNVLEISPGHHIVVEHKHHHNIVVDRKPPEVWLTNPHKEHDEVATRKHQEVLLTNPNKKRHEVVHRKPAKGWLAKSLRTLCQFWQGKKR